MPNHTENRVTFNGPKAEVEKILAACMTHHPATIEETFDGKEHVYRTHTGKYGWRSKETGVFRITRNPTKDNPERFEIVEDPDAEGYFPDIKPAWDQFDLSKIIPETPGVKASLENPGPGVTPYWYEWRCENWGTKWNTYDGHREDHHILRFQTAWAPPRPCIAKLAADHPEVEIIHEYTDEGGFFWGRDIYTSGSLNEGRTQRGRDDYDALAVELYTDLNGYDPTQPDTED